MERHTILLMSDIADFGGGEANLTDHAVRLANGDRFHPVVLVPGPGILEDHLRRSGIETVRLSLGRARRILGLIPYLPLLDTIELLRSVRRLDCSLLHANSFTTALHGGLVGAILRRPVVWTCRGWDFRSDGLKGRFLHRFVRRIIATSEWVRRKVLAPGVVTSDQILLLHQGVDVNRFHPSMPEETEGLRSELGIDSEDVVFLCVGTVYPLKQQIPLVRCFESLRRQIPDVRAKLLFIGEGSPPGNAFEMELRETIARSSFVNDILFLGRRWDVERFLRAVDVVVCPSEVESFGMVVIEAMASGTPVIATSNGGPAETVVPGETGLLIDPSKPSEWTDAMMALLQNAPRRTQMGRAARTHVLAHFDKAEHQRHVEDLYASLIGP